MTGRRRSLFGYDPDPRGNRGEDRSASEEALTVSQVNSLVRRRLEGEFSAVTVRGELTNVVIAASGHLYAGLKDGTAQISVVMWRGQRMRLPFEVEDGLEVVVTGKLSLYEPRGSFQLIAATMSVHGAGSLDAQFRALKERFEKRGYFEAEHKKELPFLPTTIGVVTSSAGAAIHDIIQTITARFARAHIVLLPVRVQGPGAAAEIAAAIDRMCEEALCDVMIVGRGGGSLEDLWAFNEEVVVEAIFRADIPVISAVGHETDVTLSDMVADYRALTPTAAGEAVVPSLADLEGELAHSRDVLDRVMRDRLRTAGRALDALARSWALKEPLNYLRRVEQRLDELGRTLSRSMMERLRQNRSRLDSLGANPGRAGLIAGLAHAGERLAFARKALDSGMRVRFEAADQHLDLQGRLLRGLSPLSILERGYSLSRLPDGTIVRRAADLSPGDRLITRFAEGEADTEVRSIRDVEEDESR